MHKHTMAYTSVLYCILAGFFRVDLACCDEDLHIGKNAPRTKHNILSTQVTENYLELASYIHILMYI